MAPPERLPAMRELFLLRVVGLAILVVDDFLNDHRLSDRPTDFERVSARPTPHSADRLTLHKLRVARILQVLQLLRGFFRNHADHNGRAQRSHVFFENYPAPRDLVLHLPGGGLCRGCL